ncbi:IS1182 family transposase [Microbulbifer bruguierae]|uniref:IS1182 family transposase n=1 Tax=Microbulbifer bruguierae TaxID=3029061 RepID=A0ABY8NEV7_9GAMM|nr:IS1182 family transposase [Microbulbifer bruguierae]WGL16970.1 IS1182 family transposase [Microbulbifer bruguierae]
MPNFKRYSYAQNAMVVVDFEQQIRPGTFEFTLHQLIENHIDLSAFYDKYNNDAGGRTAYDPAILLKIILFAYYHGVRSSRDIQWECEHNILFKALSCDTVPHFTSIASFISSYPDAIANVFEQVLLVCDQEGLIGHELIAIDGCKIASNASKEHSGTLEELAQKRDKIYRQIKQCMREHQKLDRRKPRDRERKDQVEQAINTLGKHFHKIDQFLKTAAPRMGQRKRPKEVKSNITDNESAKMTTSKGTIQGYNGVAAVDKKHQVIVDAQAFGEGQEHHALKPIIEGVQNHYKRSGIDVDLVGEDVVITADTGFANEANYAWLKEEGYNAYVPDNRFRSRDPKFTGQKAKHGKRHRDTVKGVKPTIPAAEFKLDSENKLCWCPEGKLLWLYHETIDEYGKQKLYFEGNLTDCRHCPRKHECMRNPESPDTREGHGRQVSFTVNTHHSPMRWMQRRVDSRYGKQVYGHRMSVVEPVFANIGTQKGLNRFSLRGKNKVQGQWQLYCMVHNIEKIANYGSIGR